MREGDVLSLSKGWKEVTLEDIAEYGKEKIIYSKVDSSNFISADNMFPEIGGITNSDYTPTKGNISKYETGDILLSNIRPYFKKMWFADFDGGCSNDVLVLKTKSGEVNSKFLFYNLSQQEFFDFIMAGANGVKMPRGNKNALIKFKIKLPPLETQRKIASILSGYDDLIENNLKRIKILEEMAQQTYEEWFVRMRFPGYETAVLNEEMGLPEGWENGTIETVTKYLSGFAFKSAQFKENGNGVIRIKNIGNNTINLSDVAYVDNEYASKQKRYLLKSGDLLIAMTGATIGKVGIMPHSNERFYLNQRVGKFVTENTAFINCFFNSTYGINQVINIAGGAAQPNISAQQILDIELVVPSKQILNQFSDTFNKGISMIINLQSQNQRLREARDLLLPRLMMGILEV